MSERRAMTDYGRTLKRLIDFSSVKMYLVADTLGYDVSYISKWCNKGYLPNVKAAPKINGILAGLLSEDIAVHCDLESFCSQFEVHTTEEDLESTIRFLLQEAYDSSGKKDSRKSPKALDLKQGSARALVHTGEIRRFFQQDFSEYLRAAAAESEGPVEVLCTLDLCLFLCDFLPEIPFPDDLDLHVRIAIRESRLYVDHMVLLPRLYTFLSLNSRISFDIFCDEIMADANVIIIKDYMAALCSLDSEGRVLSIFCVTDTGTVQHMQWKTVPLFNRSKVLIQTSDPIDFHRKGYRTDFYSKDHFQILLASGFEFLLPRDCWEAVVETAGNKYKNKNIALLIRRLQVTWEEIFEHGSIDFFVLKTSLLRYMETGEIIFTDVVHRLTPEQRKNHIRNILDVTKNNPNIVFYLIDDEKLPVKNRLAYLSVFNNREKAFMKNPNRYHYGSGSFFYSIRSGELIRYMTDYFDDLKNTPFCTRYRHRELLSFYEKYSSLIIRMIDL
ncbi:MAG: hypothetical protein Q4D81_04365 [Eubacteriales bacterium]|nr:hypothetical protein [Eubacteriales bacterium]